MCVVVVVLGGEGGGGLLLCIVMPQLTIPLLTAILFATDDHLDFEERPPAISNVSCRW